MPHHIDEPSTALDLKIRPTAAQVLCRLIDLIPELSEDVSFFVAAGKRRGG